MHHTAQELQAFVNDPHRNFEKIRSIPARQGQIPFFTYNQHQELVELAGVEPKGKGTYKVVAHNALPKRTYPIELPIGWLD